MYQFRDVTAAQPLADSLPAEAVKFIRDDGTEFYLENEITGFRTLYVSGRESLEKEIVLYDATRWDGDKTNFTRFPSRTLTVGFQLSAASDSAFRTAFNTMNKLLNIENAKILFDDEPDKYFIGTPMCSMSVEPGRNSVTGEYQIFCADPFKYELTEQGPVYLSSIPLTSGADEYDATADYEVGDQCLHEGRLYECSTAISGGEAWNASHWDAVSALGFAVNNQGGYRAYPRFRVTFADDTSSDGSIGTVSDCGYVAFYKDDLSIQFGDDAEKQTVSVNRFSKDHTKSTLGGFANAAAGTTVPGTSYKDRAQAAADAKGIVPKYGTKASGDSSYWHGSYITHSAVAQRDFTFSWVNVFALAKNAKAGKKQKGVFRVMVLDSGNNVLVAVELFKNSTSSSKGKVRYYRGTTLVESADVDFKYTGMFGYKKSGSSYALRKKNNQIKRSGDTITIKLAGDKQRTIDVTGDTTAVAKVAFFFGQYGTAAVPYRNVLRKTEFTDSDTGNTFSANQVLEVDCSDASVVLDNEESLWLGDISNDWSGFYLDVGSNTIFTQWSDWTDLAGHPPEPVLYYRRRWI